MACKKGLVSQEFSKLLVQARSFQHSILSMFGVCAVGHLSRMPMTVAEQASLSTASIFLSGCIGGAHFWTAAVAARPRSAHILANVSQGGCSGMGSASCRWSALRHCSLSQCWGQYASGQRNVAECFSLNSRVPRTCSYHSTLPSRLSCLYGIAGEHVVSERSMSEIPFSRQMSIRAYHSNIELTVSRASPGQPQMHSLRHRLLHSSCVLADSVKRKRATKMKRHKWKKRMRLLRRKTKASQGGRA